MSERHWPRPALTTTALAMLAVAGVVGCGSSPASPASPASSASPASTSRASAHATAGMAASTRQKAYTASQLKGALLSKINGERPAARAEAGDYGALPGVQTSKQIMHGVKVKPAKCAQTTVTAFNSASFAHAPASVVTFRVGRDGVSEVLVSSSPQLAAIALGNKLPAGCSHYDATVDGKTFRYSVREASLSGISDQARALNIKAAGYAEADVWSVVYRGTGFVGAVTMMGPDASEQGVTVLAKDAYAKAVQSLSRA
jgi:hypothetical protein